MGDLTSAERAAYESNGFFVRPAVFGSRELRDLRAAVERVHHAIRAAASRAPAAEQIDGKAYQRVCGSTVKWEWQVGSREIRSMEPFRHLEPVLDALLDDPRLWRPVAALLGARSVSLFTDKLNFKRPGGAPFPWHQDSPYWAFGCQHLESLGSVQLYLDPASEANGCLWVMRGSHREGVREGILDGGRLDRLYTRIDDLGRFERVPLVAPAGSAVFFNGHIVHGSRGNRSKRSRRAIIVTYQPSGYSTWQGDSAREIARPARLGTPAVVW